jgi:sec-independent protein translocase protein TatA
LLHKLFSHGKIWCYRNPRYISGCFTFFGGKKIPELMKGLGSGIKEFKMPLKESSSDKKDETAKKKPSRFKMRRNFLL